MSARDSSAEPDPSSGTTVKELRGQDLPEEARAAAVRPAASHGEGLVELRAKQRQDDVGGHGDTEIVPTLDALVGGPDLVVVTTAGVQTGRRRERFDSPNVVIADFVDYDHLFPHVDVFVTNGGFGSVRADGTASRWSRRARPKGITTSAPGLATTTSGSTFVRSARSRPASGPPYVASSPTRSTPANLDALRAELAASDPRPHIEAALHNASPSAQR